MNFFEEKTDIHYEKFSFWAFATLFALIQSTLSNYPLLWYVVGCIYFAFACYYHWFYFESYYHLHDINKMDKYTASLSRWIAEMNCDLS